MSQDTSNLKQSLPPLRLVHFFAWMALTAVLLALSSVRNPAIPVWWIIVSLPGLVGATLAIVTAILLLMWRRRGLPVPSEPGHWILVVFTVSLACSILWVIANLLSMVETANGQQFREPQALTELVWRWGWHVSLIPTIAVELWIAWKLRSARVWSWFFAACGILTLIQVLYGPVVSPLLSLATQSFGMAANPIQLALRSVLDANGIIAVMFLAWALWVDRHQGIKRHWSHWCGVLAWISGLPSQLAVAALNGGWLEYPGV